MGILAGAGALPGEAARRIAESGTSPFIVGFEGLTDSRQSSGLHWTRLGQLRALVRDLEEARVERLLVLGKFPRTLLRQDEAKQALVLDPDEDGLALLRTIGSRDDDGLLAVVGSWLEDRGFVVCRQDELLTGMLAEAAVLGRHAPHAARGADLALGCRAVRAVGRAGIGQAVAVKDGCVIAVEAVEGTDAMIARAGRLAGPGLAIVKATRPGQDRRFDLPTIGPATIEAMVAARADGLLVEARSTLIVDRESTLEAADRAGIAIEGRRLDEATA